MYVIKTRLSDLANAKRIETEIDRKKERRRRRRRDNVYRR